MAKRREGRSGQDSAEKEMRLRASVLEHRRRLERKLADFQHSHMSNAKWRKAFRVLSSPELGLTGCRWKLVGDDYVFVTTLPEEKDLLETHLADGRFQPFSYRLIEWIEIPAQYEVDNGKGNPRTVVHQDIGAALEALSKVGHFPAELTETGLVIRGYS